MAADFVPLTDIWLLPGFRCPFQKHTIPQSGKRWSLSDSVLSLSLFSTWKYIPTAEAQDLLRISQAIFHSQMGVGIGGVMAKLERIRESMEGNLDPEYLKQRQQGGWRLVGVEWERETETDTTPEVVTIADAPFGTRVSGDCEHLEENPPEMQFLLSMMELIIQDISLTKVAEELNKKGFRTRKGDDWGPVAVFNMLPRLIELTPRIFKSQEWVERRKQLSLVY
jgi:hypothetical protein